MWLLCDALVWTIARVRIIDSWEQVLCDFKCSNFSFCIFKVSMNTNIYSYISQLFEDSEPLSTKNLEEICQEWAKYFLQVRNQNMQ